MATPKNETAADSLFNARELVRQEAERERQLEDRLIAAAEKMITVIDNEADCDDNVDGIAYRPNDAMRYQIEAGNELASAAKALKAILAKGTT